MRHLIYRLLSYRPKKPGTPAKSVLTLTDDQLYEVYRAVWREFVELHRHATTNPNGVHEAVIERVRLSRTAIGEVCDMIEAVKPHMATTDERYTTARAQADQARL